MCVTSELLSDRVMPFSLWMLLKLLFGELGPEPGALLHAESETHTKNIYIYTDTNESHRAVNKYAQD